MNGVKEMDVVNVKIHSKLVRGSSRSAQYSSKLGVKTRMVCYRGENQQVVKGYCDRKRSARGVGWGEPKIL